MEESKYDWVEGAVYAGIGAGIEHFSHSQDTNELLIKIVGMGSAIFILKFIFPNSVNKVIEEDKDSEEEN